MRGTIFKRGNLVDGPDRARPRPGYRPASSRVASGFKTKRDAEDARVEILADLQRGEHVSPDKLTVRAFLEDEWLLRHAAVAATLDV